MWSKSTASVLIYPDGAKAGDLESQAEKTDRKSSQVGSRYLEGWALKKAIIALNVANGVAFVDLIGVTALISQASKDLNAGDRIAWAATSQLLGATIGMSILGYLSDSFSRRKMMLVAQGILIVGAVLCGASRYPQQAAFFFVCRAFCGVATGSISNLMNIAINDFCTREVRSRYQGIQGISVALGSIIGMFTSAALTQQWQILYWIEAGLAVVSMALTYAWVPVRFASTKPPLKDILKSMDYLGILAGVGCILPGLTLICQYETLGTSSPTFVALVVVAAVSFVAFFTLGFMDRTKAPQADCQTGKVSVIKRIVFGVRPIVPFCLFKNRTIAAIYAQNVLFGAAYYSFTYYLPLALEVARNLSPITAAGMMTAYFCSHAITSTISARVMTWLQERNMRSYSLAFFFAFSMWTPAMALLGYTIQSFSLGSLPKFIAIVVILEIMVGFGTGATFQNGVMAITSQVDNDHKAVSLGMRNVLRFFGGAIGTSVSAAILHIVLKKSLPAPLETMADNAFAHPKLDPLSPEDRATVQGGYASASAWVFYLTSIMLAMCLMLCIFVQDNVEKVSKAPTAEDSSRTGSFWSSITLIGRATKDEDGEVCVNSKSSSSPSSCSSSQRGG